MLNSLYDLSKYLSNWSLFLFLVWSLSEKLRKYLSLELLVQVVYFGFLILYFYYLFIKKYKFSFIYLLVNFIIHYIPYKIISKNPLSKKSYYFFFSVCAIYLYYLYSNNTNFIEVYFYDIKKYLNY